MTDKSEENEEISQVQVIENFGNEINCLATANDSTLVIYTSSGNFHVYELWAQLKHKASYVKQNDAVLDLLTQDMKKTIEFENDKLKEVSAMKMFKNWLVVTYWDSDQSKPRTLTL